MRYALSSGSTHSQFEGVGLNERSFSLFFGIFLLLAHAHVALLEVMDENPSFFHIFFHHLQTFWNAEDFLGIFNWK